MSHCEVPCFPSSPPLRGEALRGDGDGLGAHRARDQGERNAAVAERGATLGAENKATIAEIVQLAMTVSAASAAEATRERDTVAMRGAAMIIVSLVAVGLAFIVGMMVGRQQAAKDVGKVVAAAHRARFDFVLQATTGRVPLDAAMSDVVDAEEDERWRTCMEVGLPIADYIATEWMNDVSASSGMEAAQLVQEYVKTNAGGIAYVRNQRRPTKPKRRKPRPAKRSPAADSE